MKLVRTTPSHPGYQQLVEALDRFLAITDGEDHAFYDQYNKSDAIQHVVVVEDEEGKAVGCGAIKPFDATSVEIKRMYTTDEVRGQGLAGRVLSELERWAAELGYQRLILETGIRQTAAIHLYDKHGYRRLTENYGPYAGVEGSICMEKYVE
ncbi:GNAT superfamily N-acetyltransferase [Lewinella aquimaris]|uniref:GNAT superfamily N-acetyltransferase n=1 Tax=Neolewinella aquimaris TaxID=1835722 RepID=A0A840E4B4_9BACT|nr:GNAT family N-acetyltransferase [Neolewinella aquimaris]MBB4078793.1 GNAT superfamily N-acetyltransferase [Neolewinella aquimaris]